MKNIAFDIVEDKETKLFNLIKVEYNLDTKEANVVSVEKIADSLPVASYKGQQLLAKKLFGIE